MAINKANIPSLSAADSPTPLNWGKCVVTVTNTQLDPLAGAIVHIDYDTSDTPATATTDTEGKCNFPLTYPNHAKIYASCEGYKDSSITRIEGVLWDVRRVNITLLKESESSDVSIITQYKNKISNFWNDYSGIAIMILVIIVIIIAYILLKMAT